MASGNSIKNKKGFTILEMSIVILLFMFAVLTVSTIYLSLINASVLANDYYQALENVRLGTEKIWRILKYGWSFRVISNGSGIIFQKKDCTTTTIVFSDNRLYYREGNMETTTVFDPELVKVNNLIIATDTPQTSETYAYFQYAPKIIILYYDLEIKSKKGATSTLIFEQAVAPLNSTYSTNLCE